jgi:hypothetical protein
MRSRPMLKAFLRSLLQSKRILSWNEKTDSVEPAPL